MFSPVKATAFDLDAPPETRPIIRRDGDGVEMVELAWGLRPKEPGGRPFTSVRAEGRRFPSHRCLVPASEFLLAHRGQRCRFALADGDWFYFAGLWRPAAPDWPEAYAILTVSANADVAPFSDRQLAVLRRGQRMEWLDLTRPEHELLRPLPRGTFCVERVLGTKRRPVLV
jgi:putative SOS response-associated peptidase YedK